MATFTGGVPLGVGVAEDVLCAVCEEDGVMEAVMEADAVGDEERLVEGVFDVLPPSETGSTARFVFMAFGVLSATPKKAAKTGAAAKSTSPLSEAA